MELESVTRTAFRGVGNSEAMKRRQRPRRGRPRAAAEPVEFISLARAAIYIEVEEALNRLIALARDRNKYIDAKAPSARALPMLIDRANRKLFPHGLHLVMQGKRARLLHRADGKTRGTNKEKAERAKEAVIAEFDELAAALFH
jgi:hypothetical protein